MAVPTQPGERRRLLAVVRALASGRRVRLRYRDAGGAATARVVTPLGLSWRRDHWLLAAHCHLRRALRHFCMDRVLAARLAPGRADPRLAPPGFDPRFFSAEGYQRAGARPAGRAAVRLAWPWSGVAPALLPAALLEWPDAGTTTCHVRVTDRMALTRLVESLGPGASPGPAPGRHAARRLEAQAMTSPPGPRHRVHSPSDVPRATAETRLLRLAAWFADQGRPVTRQDVYGAFPDDYLGLAAAKEKKFTRDKADLETLGIPVRHVAELGEAGAYVVDTGAAFLPKLEFAPAEAAAVWLAGQAALRNHDHPLRDDLEVALRKLVVGARGLPPRAATLETDGVLPEAAATRKHLDTLATALECRHRMRLRYRRPGGETTERLFDLHGYAWRRGEWLLAGHCHLRGAPRVFYLRRVESMKLVPADARRPDYDIPAGFDIRAWSRQQPWDYLVHPAREAAVRLRGSLASVAPKLLPGARLTTEPDNARTARLPVRNLAGLVRQVLAWGPEAELLEPADGRALARELLAGLRARLGVSR